MTKYRKWFELQLETLTKEDIVLFSIKLSEFPPTVFDHLKMRIKNINTKYPWNVKPNVVLFLLIAYALFWIIVLIFFLWCLKWLRLCVQFPNQ